VIPLISVVVLNYNGRAWLGPCLTALSTQSRAPEFEIVLADNGSTDGSIDFVRERFPMVTVVENGGNLGFAGGNNAGARAARGSLLAFLNNDTVPAPNWLARLHGVYAALAGPALVTSRIVWLDRPDVIDSAGDGYLRAGGAFKHGHGARVATMVGSREVFGACGAAFMIDREFFERLGGFDEDFFMVYEDVDLSYRARLAGARCFFASDAIVRHAGSATLGPRSAAGVFYGQRNLEWTWIKNTPRGLLLRTLPAHAIYSIAGIVHYVVKGRGTAAIGGKLSALLGLPRVLAERRALQSARTVDTAAIERVLTRGWIALKRAEKLRNGRSDD
jgi:N-acetylglucosaminyl-diphospho-decaprenol L-rhamnosyltransferase